MNVVNVHARDCRAAPAEAGALLDSLASESDRLWPAGAWPAMRLGGGLRVGARGGHGPIRYTVERYAPGRTVRFTFDAPPGFDGFHEYRVEGEAGSGSRLVHELRMRTHGRARLTWPLVYRPLHDALIEDSLAAGARSLGEGGPPPRWSRRVRFLRWCLSRLR